MVTKEGILARIILPNLTDGIKMSQLKGLDTYLTSGRYSYEYLLVECNNCHENTVVTAHNEYGMVWWEPEECQYCFEPFDSDSKFQEFYPEEEI